MPTQDAKAPIITPYAYGLVLGAACQCTAWDSKTCHRRRVALQFEKAHVIIPHAHGLVVGAVGKQGLAAAREGNETGHRPRVSTENMRACCSAPHTHGLVVRAAGKRRAIRESDERGHSFCVAVEDVQTPQSPPRSHPGAARGSFATGCHVRTVLWPCFVRREVPTSPVPSPKG